MKNINFKESAKVYVRDWRFWYKAVMAVICWIAVLTPVLYDLFNIEQMVFSSGELANKKVFETVYSNGSTGYNYWMYLVFTFTFFTLQSNILVAIWFTYAAIFHTREGKCKMLSTYFSNALATYITLTCLIAMGYMLPAALINNALGTTSESANPMAASWNSGLNKTLSTTIQLMLHSAIPIAMVLYVTLWMRTGNVISNKEFMKKYSWKYLIYPICYIVMVLFSETLLRKGNAPYVLQAPYYFFYIWQNGGQYDGIASYPLNNIHIPGYAWAIISTFLLLGIVFGFGVLYNQAFLARNKNANNSAIKTVAKPEKVKA